MLRPRQSSRRAARLVRLEVRVGDREHRVVDAVLAAPCSSIQPTMWSASTRLPASMSRIIEALHSPVGSVRRSVADWIDGRRAARGPRASRSRGWPASARSIASRPPGAAMISRTLPRKRHVVAASAERNTIFSQSSCSMSGESFESHLVFAKLGGERLRASVCLLVALAEDDAMQRVAVHHGAVLAKHRVDVRGAAHHAFAAEARIERARSARGRSATGSIAALPVTAGAMASIAESRS